MQRHLASATPVTPPPATSRRAMLAALHDRMQRMDLDALFTDVGDDPTALRALLSELIVAAGIPWRKRASVLAKADAGTDPRMRAHGLRVAIRSMMTTLAKRYVAKPAA